MNNIFNIQKFSTHDGPGTRTAIFFKGCNMNCFWCHNPESIHFRKELNFNKELCVSCLACTNVCPNGCHEFAEKVHKINREKCSKCFICTNSCPYKALEIVGREYSIDELLEIILKDKIFYDVSNGGVTLTGGEALCQAEYVLNLIKRLKDNKIHVAIETNLNHDYAVYEKANPFVDLYLCDIKDTNRDRHKKNTGVSNERMIDNLISLDQAGKKTVIVALLINTINNNTEHFEKLISLYARLKNCLGIKLLKYHELGDAKNLKLDKKRQAKNEYNISNKEFLEIKAYFLDKKINLVDF